jgi:DNA mismatch endonuclease (patch repair protein)
VDVPVRGTRRRVDVLFPTEKLAVLVHGCFWHWCPRHGHLPKANANFWREKLEANRGRDKDTIRRLTRVGFNVVVVWEHEDPAVAAETIAGILKDLRAELAEY